MSSEIAISVSNLSKCYQIYDRPADRLKQMVVPKLQALVGEPPTTYGKAFWAVKDVSFEVRKGETVGIIGRNGSGKSTLLQMICGTLNPTSGSVVTHGRVAALLELGSGFNPEFTGRENVFVNATVLGLTQAQTRAKFDDIEAFADIGEFIDQPVKTYSSGMMVRLAFAVIAHVEADILVIDEALAVGDAFFTQKCMRFLRSFMQTNTVLFVSHDTASIKSLCTAAVWMEKGTVLESGSPKVVSDLYLQAFYEARHGVSTTTTIRSDYKHEDTRVKRDQRLDFLNQTNLRNDLRIFEFDPDAASFGRKGAKIVSVTLEDAGGHPLSWMVGGEDVRLCITVMAHETLASPIIGFYVKDKLGQFLFGDNTYITTLGNAVHTEPNQLIVAEFGFVMPRLSKGEYSIGAAIADGTQDQHEQHHWIHDAMVFKSDSSSLSAGLIGIPMHHIELQHALPAQR